MHSREPNLPQKVVYLAPAEPANGGCHLNHPTYLSHLNHLKLNQGRGVPNHLLTYV